MKHTSVFVYGTLMRGQPNHARYCRGVLSIRPGAVRGRLFHLSAGYPALTVDLDTILYRATGDARADEAALREWDRRLRSRQRQALEPGSQPDGGLVHGELLSLSDPAPALRRLDALEHFVPGGEGLYDRVIIAVRLSGIGRRAAWTYVQHAPRGIPLPGGRWPPP